MDLIISRAGEFPSLALLLVKLVHELEQKEFREDKKLIVRKVIGHLKANISDCEAASSLMEFVEEMHNKNKYRGEEIDEIKLISQPLVDAEAVNWMLDTLRSA